MKIIAVGDIHGRDTWKKVLEQEADFDMFVFVGDYFDNWPPMTVERIIANFQEILEFKKQRGGQVVLGIGNHDFQYMPVSGGTERYSGYNPMTQMQLDAMGDWWRFMEAAYQYQNTLFTHAGVTKTWAKDNGIPESAAANLYYHINKTFATNPDSFKFFDGDRSHCGEHVKQGPFWVRPETLRTDVFPGLNMVVGHTHTEGVDSIGPITMIDTGKQGEYLKIIDGVMHTGTI